MNIKVDKLKDLIDDARDKLLEAKEQSRLARKKETDRRFAIAKANLDDTIRQLSQLVTPVLNEAKQKLKSMEREGLHKTTEYQKLRAEAGKIDTAVSEKIRNAVNAYQL